MSDTVNPFPYFWTHKERETLTLYRTTPPVLGHVEQKGREKGIIMLFWVKRIRQMVNFELEHVGLCHSFCQDPGIETRISRSDARTLSYS